MAYNNKYTSYLDIWARLARVHKTKSFSANEIVEWCAEVEHDILEDIEGFIAYNNVFVPVVNLAALLPCNLYRLLDVFINKDYRLNYVNQGEYLTFSSEQVFEKNDRGQDGIRINFWGIPVDPATGYPLIKKGHELACEAYCIHQAYYEDYLLGRIDGQRWSVIERTKDNELNSAMNGFRHWDRKDLERISLIKMNMLPKIGQIPLFNLEWNEHAGFVNSL